MAEIVDAYSHLTTEDTLDALESVHPNPELDSLRTAPRMTDVAGRIEYLDRHGIDRQVIGQLPGPMWYGAELDQVVDATRVGNDEIRRIADEHPDRFVPIGNLPGLTGEYVEEARRCVRDLDMAGIQVFSNVGGRLLDDQAFEPFWTTVDELDVPVWIHPQLHDWHDWGEGETWIYKMLGWPFDTSVAIARLLFFGVLERHRNVELVTHHLGGTIPYLVGRFHSWYRTRKEEPELYDDPRMADLSEPIEAYLDRIYGDTAVSSVGEHYPLRCGYEFFGPENVLYGADYPFGPDEGEYWTGTILAAIDELDVPETDKAKIRSGNVERLLGG